VRRLSKLKLKKISIPKLARGEQYDEGTSLRLTEGRGTSGPENSKNVLANRCFSGTFRDFVFSGVSAELRNATKS